MSCMYTAGLGWRMVCSGAEMWGLDSQFSDMDAIMRFLVSYLLALNIVTVVRSC
jgi:hypothetical protein